MGGGATAQLPGADQAKWGSLDPTSHLAGRMVAGEGVVSGQGRIPGRAAGLQGCRFASGGCEAGGVSWGPTSAASPRDPTHAQVHALGL